MKKIMEKFEEYDRDLVNLDGLVGFAGLFA